MDQNTLSSESQTLKEDPSYQRGIGQINSGQWPQALQSFQMLQKSYPDHPEVKKWLDEIHMRTVLAQPQPSVGDPGRPIIPRLATGLAVVAIVAVAAYFSYILWIDPVFIQELRVRRVTNLRTTADEAIAAGDYEQARQALQELQEIVPEDPETVAALRQVEQVETLSALYQESKALLAAEDWEQAIESLTELQDLDAQYRDLPQLLEVAKEAQALNEKLRTAEEAFTAGDWEAAVAQYRAIQQSDLTFKFDEIQTRLFESYLSQGQLLISSAENDPQQIAAALSQFAEAQKLRPLDEQILEELRLAEAYLAALNAATQDEKINLLQDIYASQPGYANQEAAQLLYSMLMVRAEAAFESGNEASAVADYQLAAQLMVEDTSEALEKLAALTAGE